MILVLAVFIMFILMVFSLKASISLYKSSGILKEFNQPVFLFVLVLLYPLIPILLEIGSAKNQLIIFGALSILLCVPASIIANRQNSALECAGTDRVDNARKALTLAFSGGLVSMLYIGFKLFGAMVYSFASSTL